MEEEGEESISKQNGGLTMKKLLQRTGGKEERRKGGNDGKFTEIYQYVAFYDQCQFSPPEKTTVRSSEFSTPDGDLDLFCRLLWNATGKFGEGFPDFFFSNV